MCPWSRHVPLGPQNMSRRPLTLKAPGWWGGSRWKQGWRCYAILSMFDPPSSLNRCCWLKGTWICGLPLLWQKNVPAEVDRLLLENWQTVLEYWTATNPRRIQGPYQDIYVWVDRGGIGDVHRSEAWTKCCRLQANDRRAGYMEACTLHMEQIRKWRQVDASTRFVTYQALLLQPDHPASCLVQADQEPRQYHGCYSSNDIVQSFIHHDWGLVGNSWLSSSSYIFKKFV